MVIGGRFSGVPGADGAGENGSSSSSEPEPFAARLVVNGRLGGRVPAPGVQELPIGNDSAHWWIFGVPIRLPPETGQRDEGD